MSAPCVFLRSIFKIDNNSACPDASPSPRFRNLVPKLQALLEFPATLIMCPPLTRHAACLNLSGFCNATLRMSSKYFNCLRDSSTNSDCALFWNFDIISQSLEFRHGRMSMAFPSIRNSFCLPLCQMTAGPSNLWLSPFLYQKIVRNILQCERITNILIFISNSIRSNEEVIFPPSQSSVCKNYGWEKISMG